MREKGLEWLIRNCYTDPPWNMLIINYLLFGDVFTHKLPAPSVDNDKNTNKSKKHQLENRNYISTNKWKQIKANARLIYMPSNGQTTPI